MFTKPALGFLFAFLGLIGLAYLGLQLLHGELSVDAYSIGLVSLTVVSMLGGCALVVAEEVRGAR